MNGALHWLVSLGDELICTYFYLAEEKYGLPQLPDYQSDQSYCEIGVLGGCFCMYRYVSDITFEVWFMKEHGMVESWTSYVQSKGRSVRVFAIA